jgi:hypothetical protein
VVDFIVVGHGLTPVGRKWGKKIDRANTVIRMWNFHWQNPVDWGRKYDFGFLEVSPTEMVRFQKHNCKVPTTAWLASDLAPYTGTLPAGAHIVWIRPGGWVERAIKLGGKGDRNKYLKLTRGVRAAAWAIERRPKRVILVGFDNVKEGIALTIEEGYPPEYVSCPATFPFRDYTGGQVRYSSHDYSVEWPFLSMLAEENNVRLVFAEDIWK